MTKYKYRMIKKYDPHKSFETWYHIERKAIGFFSFLYTYELMCVALTPERAMKDLEEKLAKYNEAPQRNIIKEWEE